MKKVLLGTSAIALASAFATSANAAEWSVKVGGYMEQHAAYAASDVDGVSVDQDGIDSKQDAEIHFKPSITLDNGLKIGVDVQLEAATNSDTIDEAFLFIKGSFGEVLLGSENSAGYKMSYGAPDVSFIGLSSGSTTAFIPFSGTVGPLGAAATCNASPTCVNTGDDIYRGTLGSGFLENARNNDAQRFTYFTPRFAGFQLGASYARDGNQDNNAQIDTDEAGTLHDIFDIGANYVNSFGPVDIAISGRWGIATIEGPNGSDPTVFHTGANVGFDVGGGKVTVGGSFGEQNEAGAMDGTMFDAGISYTTGPWGFSFTYFQGENVDNENAALGADEERKAYLLAATYALAKGVKVQAFGAYEDFDEEIGDAGGPNAATGDDVDGFIVGTGIKVSF